MNITDNKITFKGYDARPLAGLIVTDPVSAKELKQLSSQTGIDVYTPNIASKSIRKDYADLTSKKQLLWAQDYFTMLNQKAGAVLFDNTREHIRRVLRATSDGLKKSLKLEPIKSEPHIRGGNFFICDNVEGKKKLLINENRLLYPQNVFKVIYGVDEVCPIPKLDYHLDLFVRPLDNGKVLVADESLTIEGLEKGKAKIQEYIKNHPEEKEQMEKVIEQIELHLQKFDVTREFAPYKSSEIMPELVQRLESYGFMPIRVPATYYYLDGVKNEEKAKERIENFNKNVEFVKSFAAGKSEEMKQVAAKYLIEMQMSFCKEKDRLGVELQNFYNNNFINAIVSKNEAGKLIYITNAPLLDKELGITPDIAEKIGFSTKDMFIESVSPYIDRENIHFISEDLTERLFKYMGGIHCTSAEIVK